VTLLLVHILNLINLFLGPTSSSTEVYYSNNSLAPQKPCRIDLTAIHGSPNLEPGGSVELPLFLHAEKSAEQDLHLLLVFREVPSNTTPTPYILLNSTFRMKMDRSMPPVSCETMKFGQSWQFLPARNRVYPWTTCSY